MDEDKIGVEKDQIRGPVVSKSVGFLVFKYILLMLIMLTIIAYSVEIPLGIRGIKELKYGSSNTAFVQMSSNPNEDLFERYINFDYDRTNPLSVRLFKRYDFFEMMVYYSSSSVP